MIKYITNPIHSLTQSYTAATITSLLTQQPRTGTSQPVPPGPSGIENDAHGIEKLLLKTQVSLTSFLQSEVKIIHIIVQSNTYIIASLIVHTCMLNLKICMADI